MEYAATIIGLSVASFIMGQLHERFKYYRKTGKHLQDAALPAEILNDIRLNAAIVRNVDQGAPNRRTDQLIEFCNTALEMKRGYYFTMFEDLDENPIGI